MDAVEQPPAVGLPLGLHDRYRLRHPGIGVRTRLPEVVQRTQRVVVPVVRERELQIRRLDDGPCAFAAEQAALKQVLLTAAAGRAHLLGPADRALELQQAVEHVDRRVHRGSHRSVLGLAVPAAVSKPFGEDPLDDRCDVHPEVRPGLDCPAVDAGLDLPVEVPLPGVLPAPVLRHQPDRPAGGVRRRVKPEELQSLQRVHRGRPGLPRFTAFVGRREAGAAVPEPGGILEREQARAPAVVLHPGSLGCHLAGRRVREIPQHLPADGGVAFEQPVDHAHDRRLPGRRRPVRPPDTIRG